MIRHGFILSLALLAAGCAAKVVQQPSAPVSGIAPAPARGEPTAYVNMQAMALQAILGKPAFVRKDGATEMWRYDGQTCRAFFFLYGSPLMVRHVETLPHGGQTAADTACLMALQPVSARPS